MVVLNIIFSKANKGFLEAMEEMDPLCKVWRDLIAELVDSSDLTAPPGVSRRISLEKNKKNKLVLTTMLKKSEKSVVLLLQQDQPYKTRKNKQTLKTVQLFFP